MGKPVLDKTLSKRDAGVRDKPRRSLTLDQRWLLDGLDPQRLKLVQTEQVVNHFADKFALMHRLYRLLSAVPRTQDNDARWAVELSQTLTRLKRQHVWIGDLSRQNADRVCYAVAHRLPITDRIDYHNTGGCWLARTVDKHHTLDLHLPDAPLLQIQPVSGRQAYWIANKHVFLIRHAMVTRSRGEVGATVWFPKKSRDNALPKLARRYMKNYKVASSVLLKHGRLEIDPKLHERDVTLLMHVNGWVGPKRLWIGGRRVRGYEWVGPR